MEKIKGFLRMVRPINCAMMGFAVLVGALLTNSQALWISWRNITFGFLTGFLLTAASMVVNDYYDREIDAINEPTRPIPSGLIKPEEALT
ncbi:MAG: UbiA family prenyltransferase, partial [Candidatus Bathyarchaeia archaeon]